MSKLINSLAADSTQTVNHMSSTGSLIYTITTTTTNFDAAVGTTDKGYKIIQFLNEAVTSTFQMKPKVGTDIVYHPTTGLGTLAEDSQNGVGYIDVKTDGANVVIRVMIRLTSVGAVYLEDDAKFVLTAVTGPDVTLSVDAVDHYIASPTYREVSLVSIGQGIKDYEFKVDDVDTLFLPLTAITSTTKIEFTYTNGKTMEYTREQLEAMGFLANDVLVNDRGSVCSGFGMHAIFDATAMKKVRVRRDSVTAFDFTIFRDRIVPDVNEVSSINSGVVNTTQQSMNRELASKISF